MFIITAVLAVNSWFGKSGAGFSSGLLPDWKYRRPIILSGQQEDLTDYQVKVELTPSNFDYSHCQSDLNDIRFTDANDNRLLDFWIETASTTATSTIWIKVPALSANKQSKIYMYYGNAGASSASDGEATFEFFDDFEGTSIDPDKWSVISGTTVSTDQAYTGKQSAKQTANTNTLKHTFPTALSTGIMEAQFYDLKEADLYCKIWIDSSVDQRIQPIEIWSNRYNYWSDAGEVAYTTPRSVGWHYTKFVLKAANSETVCVDDECHDITGTCEDIKHIRVLDASNYTWYVDTIRVRKYTSPEPTATVGKEQTQMTPIAHWRFDEGSGTKVYSSIRPNQEGTLYSSTTVCSDPPTAGCPAWTTGRFNTGLKLDGIDDYINFGDIDF